MRFAEFFKIRGTQAELDFVDVALNADIRVFIDPHALSTTDIPWCQKSHALAWDFFQVLPGFAG